MCIYASSCNPEQQMLPSKEHPYGTEWVFCKKVNGFYHCDRLTCIGKTFTNKLVVDDDEIVRLYVEENYNLCQLEEMFDCSKYYIIQLLKNKKVFKKKIPVIQQIEKWKDEILLLNDNGMIYKDIVRNIKEKYNVSVNMVALGEKIRKWREQQ